MGHADGLRGMRRIVHPGGSLWVNSGRSCGGVVVDMLMGLIQVEFTEDQGQHRLSAPMAMMDDCKDVPKMVFDDKTG
ncbi:MAG: hypothetical protein VX589_11895 [Myxococcota bacterium]|nr:hypothetical protein [Myxococcota bacterium]